MPTLDTDYLIIGAGATGLAFADTLVAETDAHVTFVDQRGQPGGHWVDAYGFVTLHQPSAFYGVNSMELGQRRVDTHGPNAGLYELASGAEVCGYFDRAMQRLLGTGRVAYHPMCRWLGSLAGAAEAGPGEFESLLSGERTTVNVRRKLVDARYLSPGIPSTHVPRFSVAPGARLVPPNALPGLWQAPPAGGGARHFVIIGAGKTAMDTAVWLLKAGALPQQIQWVVPRDSWLINRITTQPGFEFFDAVFGSQADQMAAFGAATSVDDLFLRLEACGALLRIDRSRTPTMFHLATVSPGEVELLQRIDNVIRLGHVQHVGLDELVLDQGRVPLAPDTLCIDCTASAVTPRPLQPIFQPGRIVPQLVRLPQPAFSAALVAWVEAHGGDATEAGDAAKNALCGTVPFPHTLADYPRAVMANMRNQFTWSQHKALRQWVRDSRLDGFGKLMADIDPQDNAKLAILARLKQQSMAAMANLPKLVAGTA